MAAVPYGVYFREHRILMANPTSDAELIALARAGDDRAFGALVERYEGAVAATAIGMLGPRRRRRRRRPGDVHSISPCARQLSRRLVAQDVSRAHRHEPVAQRAARRRRLLLRFVSRDETRDRPAGAATWARTARWTPASCARSCAPRSKRLSEKHRAVVVLRMFQDCSTRETAQILGVPEGTVLSRLSRAMKELETHLAPYVRRGERRTAGDSAMTEHETSPHRRSARAAARATRRRRRSRLGSAIAFARGSTAERAQALPRSLERQFVRIVPLVAAAALHARGVQLVGRARHVGVADRRRAQSAAGHARVGVFGVVAVRSRRCVATEHAMSAEHEVASSLLAATLSSASRSACSPTRRSCAGGASASANCSVRPASSRTWRT